MCFYCSERREIRTLWSRRTPVYSRFQFQYWFLAHEKMVGPLGFEPRLRGVKARGACPLHYEPMKKTERGSHYLHLNITTITVSANIPPVGGSRLAYAHVVTRIPGIEPVTLLKGGQRDSNSFLGIHRPPCKPFTPWPPSWGVGDSPSAIQLSKRPNEDAL